MAKNSGITKGKSHKEGGIPMEVKSTGQKIEVEGGEGIVNKYAMSNTDTFKFDGKEKTSCEIISDLNQKKGDGVSFECDTVESKKYKYAKGGSLNFDSAETFYEAMEGVIEKGNEFIDKHEYKGDRHGKSKLAVNIKLYDVNYGIDAALDSYQSRRGNFDLEKEEYVKKDLRIDEEWTYKMYNDFLNDQVYFLVEDLLEKYGEVLEEKQIYQVGRMGGWLVFSDNGELNTNVDELENTLNNNFSEDGELVGYDRWGYDMEPVTFTEFKEEGDYDDALYYTKRINLLLDIYKEVAQDIKEAKDGVADSWKAHLDEKVEEHISENKKRFKIFTEDDPDFAKGGRLEGIPWNTVYTDEPFIQLDVDRKIGYIKALVERHNDKMNRYYDLAGEDGEHRSHSATKKIKQQAYNLESHIGGYIDAYNKLHPNQFKGGNITLSDFNLEYAKGGKVEVEVYYNEDGTPKGVWRKGYQGSNNMKKKIMSVPKLDWEKGKINSKNILNYAKGGDLYEYRSGNYEILIWETEEHREHLGPDRIFPKGTTDEEVISEAKGLFEDFASVEVEKNGEVIYHISNDRPKGKKFENGGHISKHPIRANNSSLLRYANFQDGSHINLLQLTPRLGGLTYKNPYKFAVSVSSIKKGQIVTEFITLKEAEKVFEKSVGTRGAKTPLIDMQYDGYVNEPFAQGGSVYDRSQDRAIEGNTSHINSNKEEIDHYGLASSDALELAQENEDTIDNMRQGTNKVLNNLYEKNPSLKYKKGGATPSFSIRKSFYNETIGSNEKTGTGEDFRTVYFMIGQDGVSQNVLLSEAPEDYEFEVSEEVYVDYTDSSGNTQKAYMEANSPDEVVRTLRDNHNAVSIERARMEWEDDKKISDYKKI